MNWIQAIQQQFSQHKYAINAKILGDDALYAWTNLGYWTATTQSYPQACRQLADQLAQAVDLNSSDHLLDLGCGRGASILHWKNYYKTQRLSAVDMQQHCIDQLQHNLNSNIQFYSGSFLNLKNILSDTHFDVVLCVDAAYHSDLNLFLASVRPFLNSKGRIGFHYLMLTDKWQNLSSFEQEKYRLLLKSADVQIKHLPTQTDIQQIMQQYRLENIQIDDLSERVLLGFADYISQRKFSGEHKHLLDSFKIKMTAKLCNKLYTDGLVRYIQITAQKGQ
ncbi:class I SAM-dependent methyltransferase [Acinetobacter defluvii]|uniref:Class I SAM-dependent methyltransferase n=1 Tax=Acinetobacter defluvii TaxID=1871111 RepID=A0A2S2FA49_9GAMM|nr:class I SAM-dependent methyltransferase [Acinetobacter defluvii]AWL27758.1 class I SAM-dependent methyltransferase [Acinetobacter defluvii]